MTMHNGLVYSGLRYSAYLRGLGEDAYVMILRNEIIDPKTGCQIYQRFRRQRGKWLWRYTLSLTDIVDKAIATIQEYDATLEVYKDDE